MYKYNHLTFLSDINTQSKTLRIINIVGATTHIITEPKCTIRIINNTLEIKQEHDSNTIILDFLNKTVTKIAHNRLRDALILLSANNTTEQNNLARVINIGPLQAQITNWEIDENDLNIIITNAINNTSFVVDENEIVFFNVSINYFENTSDITTYKFTQIRKYLFKLGKGIYVNNNFNIDNLILLDITKGYKFIDLYDINLANNENKILSVNADGDGITYKSLSEIAKDGFETEYYIDMLDNNRLEIGLNSKLIIKSIELINIHNSNFNNFKINGNIIDVNDPNSFPILLDNIPEILTIENDDDVEFNMKVFKFIL